MSLAETGGRPPRTRILLVDDDANVLQGLRRALRPLRGEWDVELVDGAQQALARMADRPVDVMVTDLRMPGMSGDALLAEVARTSPQVIRIVLSGETKLATYAATIGPAHQYLSKPCDPERLISTIRRAAALRSVLTSPELRRLVARLQSVPVRPASLDEVIREIQSDDPSIRRVAEIVADDAGLSAKVMQLVNSAFFGLRAPVTDPSQAVLLLGLDVVQPLVLSASVFHALDTGTCEYVSPEALWLRGARVAAYTRHIGAAEELPDEVIRRAFLAGLLHDVGKMILADQVPDQCREAVAISRERRVPLWQSEKTVLGDSHAEVGGYLAGLWGFSNSIVEAITYHHQPARHPAPALDETCMVHVACMLANARGPHAGRIDRDYIAQVGMESRIDRWRDTAEIAGI